MRPAFLLPALIAASLFSCKDKKSTPAAVLIKDMSLKRGDLIVCGPADQQLGTVAFDITGTEKSKADFILGVKLLHSFEYDEAEKVFARIIDAEPGCAMAFWGVAMSNFHPLWAPPSEPELKKGAKAASIAHDISKTEKEHDFSEAIGAFYDQYDKLDHRTRCRNFENAMEKLHDKYYDDKEAAIFYALALNAAADPADKSFTKQKKAGQILNALYPGNPDHPGIIHYIIHTYDYPELASLALPAARKYASVAASSAHALHMPSHIFTRLGLWDECIHSNLAMVNSAQCYAQSTGLKGHWDEELHGLDYLAYAYLQKGANDSAKMQWDYLKTINEIHPANFKVAYAFAAIPSRYVLENKMWAAAAVLQLDTANIAWQDFPWQKAIYDFARLMGAVHTNNKALAQSELNELKRLRDTLLAQKDAYKAGQVAIQIKTGEAWMQWQQGRNKEALALMQEAADMEDKTEKHPVTPGEVIPARELLGDMLVQMKKYNEALEAYESNLKKHPNRFNSLYGAGMAAELSGQKEKANLYYRTLLQISQPASTRPELKTITKNSPAA
jgi:hypothetical protein